jgi:hypothetical protein
MTEARRMADLPDTLRLLDPLMALSPAPSDSTGFGILAADGAARGEEPLRVRLQPAVARPPPACPLAATAYVDCRRSRGAMCKSWHAILEPFVSPSHKFSSLLARQVS